MKIYSYLILALLLIVLSCCKYQRNDSFESYCSSVKTVNTPFNLWCGISKEQLNRSHQDTLFQSLFNLPNNLIGRLYPEKSFVTLLFGYPADYMVAYLHTFTKDGHPIDTLCAGGTCFADPGYISSSITYFNNDLTISIIDTIKTIAIDSVYNEINGTDSLFVLTVRHKLEDNGKFSFIDSNKIYISKY